MNGFVRIGMNWPLRMFEDVNFVADGSTVAAAVDCHWCVWERHDRDSNGRSGKSFTRQKRLQCKRACIRTCDSRQLNLDRSALGEMV